jgi:polyhydroxybutyrate depolymerase
MKRNLVIVALLGCCISGCALTIGQEPAKGLIGESTAVDPLLKAGDHDRKLVVDELERIFIVHVPPNYDKAKPTPLVIAMHGLGLPAEMMPSYTQLNKTADEQGFIVVYPAGSGVGFSWNAGARKGPLAEFRADEVKFISAMLDDLEKVLNVDKRRVYATGMSNGGMMCYLLANSLSDRIAAIAPVSGTMTYTEITSKRPVPVIHFHGTDDGMVPYGDGRAMLGGLVLIQSAPNTIKAWAKFDGCKTDPIETELKDKEADGTTVTKFDYGVGRDGAEVVHYMIKGGGHTWPGVTPPVKQVSDRVLGLATFDISANELMWEFFKKHPMPEKYAIEAKKDPPVKGARSL